MVEMLALSALPARPPTPPRSSSHSASFTGDIRRLHTHQPLMPLPADDLSSTPDLSPLPHSGIRSKRVNFSPLTSYIKPPAFANSSNSKPRSPLKTLPPSNQKPSRSILKVTCSSTLVNPSNDLISGPLETFAVMLESVTQQL